MGCDLHAVVVSRPERGYGQVLMTFNEPRDYRMFAAMADVRNYMGITPVSKPRGLPHWWTTVGEHKPNDEPTFYLNGADIGLGDHSFSWLTTAEFEDAIQRAQSAPSVGGDVDPAYTATLAFMQSLDATGWRSTLVFGFDN